MSRKRKRVDPGPKPVERRYEVVLTKAATRGLSGLPKTDLPRVDAKIRALGDDPRPPSSKKLTGVENLYRIRSGDYRVLYRIDDRRQIIDVVDVGHRRNIYDSL